MPIAASLDLVLIDRETRDAEPFPLPPAGYEAPRFSPDGKHVAVSTDDGSEAAVWVQRLSRGASLRRLTLNGRNRFPVWSADSKWIAFQSNREGDLAIYAQAADGSDTAVRLTRAQSGETHLPETWSATHLLYSSTAKGRVTLWSYSIADRRAAPFGNVESSTPTSAAFSPDGKWVAYTVSLMALAPFRAITTSRATAGSSFEREIAGDAETRAGAPARIQLITNWFELLRGGR